jgi:hypothetical protein
MDEDGTEWIGLGILYANLISIIPAPLAQVDFLGFCISTDLKLARTLSRQLYGLAGINLAVRCLELLLERLGNMKASFSLISALALRTLACDSCYGPAKDVVLTRLVRRAQPDALNATAGPKNALQWGQVNFVHTTDTHGWLEGHLKEPNYGADWGDFVSFTRAMKQKAQSLGVDLLLVDTGVSLVQSSSN